MVSGVQYWGRVSMLVWSLEASVSSVPVLLHRCLWCLHGFPLHPHRLVLSFSCILRAPWMWAGEGEYYACDKVSSTTVLEADLSQGPQLFKV